MEIDEQKDMRKLRWEERIGVGHYLHIGILTAEYKDTNGNIISRRIMIINSNNQEEQLEELKKGITPTLVARCQQIGIDVIIEGVEKDKGNEYIVNSILHACSKIEKFKNCNVIVRILLNQLVANDTARVPNNNAKFLWEGAMTHFINQNNMLGLCSSRAVISFSMMLDLSKDNESPLITSAEPGHIQYTKKYDNQGKLITGKNLTKKILENYNTSSGRIISTCYGITQEIDSFDADKMLKIRAPNVNIGHYDEIEVNIENKNNLTNNYHGFLMALGAVEKKNKGNYGLIDDRVYGKMFEESSCMYKCLKEAVEKIYVPEKFNLRIGFLSSSIKKATEANKFANSNFSYINQKWNDALKNFSVQILRIPFEKMPEDQEINAVEVLENKVDNTRFKLSQISALMGLDGIFIDDTSFSVEAMNGAPGPLYRSLYDNMQDTTNKNGITKYNYDNNYVKANYGYNNLICDQVTMVCNNDPSKNRKAIATTIFGCHISTPYGSIIDCTLKSDIHGTIPMKPRGNREFGWDSIFIPDDFEDEFMTKYSGNGETYASIDDAELSKLKPRGAAMRQLFVAIITSIIGKSNNLVTGEYESIDKETAEKLKKDCNAKSSLIMSALQNGTISVCSNNTGSVVSDATINTSKSNMDALRAAFEI